MIFDISSEAAECGPSLNCGRSSSHPVQRYDDLFLKLQPILDGLSKKFSNGNPHLQDDLNQVGALAVFKAMQRFKPQKGSLTHYASRYARGAMLHHRRWLRKFDPEISLNEIRFESDGDNDFRQGWDSILRDDSAEQSLISTVDGALLRDLAVSVLTVRERNVILLIFFNGNLPGEAAVALGVSAPRVTQLLQSAVAKLRTHLTSKTACSIRFHRRYANPRRLEQQCGSV
jgi:RNA polymerase sigma factor (sigma-70 family)